MAKKQIELKILDSRLGNEFPLPHYATAGSAAVDLRAMFKPGVEQLIIHPDQTIMIPTGFSYHINDPNLCAMVLSRSGLGNKFGIIIGHAVGLIDSDYTDQLFVPCWNRSNDPYTMILGERIAQMVFVPVVQVEFNVISEFSDDSENERQGGFGHTGRI